MNSKSRFERSLQISKQIHGEPKLGKKISGKHGISKFVKDMKGRVANLGLVSASKDDDNPKYFADDFLWAFDSMSLYAANHNIKIFHYNPTTSLFAYLVENLKSFESDLGVFIVSLFPSVESQFRLNGFHKYMQVVVSGFVQSVSIVDDSIEFWGWTERDFVSYSSLKPCFVQFGDKYVYVSPKVLKLALFITCVYLYSLQLDIVSNKLIGKTYFFQVTKSGVDLKVFDFLDNMIRFEEIHALCGRVNYDYMHKQFFHHEIVVYLPGNRNFKSLSMDNIQFFIWPTFLLNWDDLGFGTYKISYSGLGKMIRAYIYIGFRSTETEDAFKCVVPVDTVAKFSTDFEFRMMGITKHITPYPGLFLVDYSYPVIVLPIIIPWRLYEESDNIFGFRDLVDLASIELSYDKYLTSCRGGPSYLSILGNRIESIKAIKNKDSSNTGLYGQHFGCLDPWGCGFWLGLQNLSDIGQVLRWRSLYLWLYQSYLAIEGAGLEQDSKFHLPIMPLFSPVKDSGYEYLDPSLYRQAFDTRGDFFPSLSVKKLVDIAEKLNVKIVFGERLALDLNFQQYIRVYISSKSFDSMAYIQFCRQYYCHFLPKISINGVLPVDVIEPRYWACGFKDMYNDLIEYTDAVILYSIYLIPKLVQAKTDPKEAMVVTANHNNDISATALVKWIISYKTASHDKVYKLGISVEQMWNSYVKHKAELS